MSRTDHGPPSRGPSRHRLGDLAGLLGGDVEGDPDLEVVAVRPLDAAGPEHLSFLTQARYARAARSSGAGAILTGPSGRDLGLSAALLIVEDPQAALAQLIDHMVPPAAVPQGVHPTALIGAGCEFGEGVSVGPYAVVGDRCRLGDGVVLGAHVAVGEGCELGAGSVLHARAVLYDSVVMGARCVIHSGAVLGADGFGFVTSTGLPTKLRQIGRVVLGDEVEVGANSAIDRAMLEETRIGSGTKIDNLVQVGHNVEVGEGCFLCGQAGIAGSAKLGNRVVLAGQAGVSGHLEIGDGVQVAAKSAVLQSVQEGEVVAGIPAIGIRSWQRQSVALQRLAELRRRVAALERLASRAASDGGAGDDEA